MTDSIQVSFTRKEALVLFSYLVSLGEKGLVPVDEAERKVIWRLEGQLESNLIEVIQPDYKEKVLTAKTDIMNDRP
jgi:hypothetical protein